MVPAQVMVGVITQVEFAIVLKDFKETSVKVISFVCKQMYLWLRWNSKFIITEIICPGDGYCSYNGWCDVASGTCSCFYGNYGNTSCCFFKWGVKN